MKTPSKIIATVLAATLATGSMAAPASAWLWVHPPIKKKVVHGGGSSKTGGLVVGCVMGSAFGLISAAIIKGGGLKWMSQKEFETTPRDKSKELTSQEAAVIAFTCGLGAFPVIAGFRRQPQPQPIRTRY
ncbi:MAG: hypothetical protein WD871_15815 [Xanthobacteraceae bacterium]